LSILNFENTKNKIDIRDKAKKRKRDQVYKLYENLSSKGEEFLDILMLQIGKDIEEKFPGVKFRLISRIKTQESLSDKLENDLEKADTQKEIKDIKIYDIIALSVVVEYVPSNIMTNDDSFNKCISTFFQKRTSAKNTKKDYQKQINEHKQKIEQLKRFKIEKEKFKETIDKKIAEFSEIQQNPLDIIDTLLQNSGQMQNEINFFDEQIKLMNNNISSFENSICETEKIINESSNECNHILADYLIRNLGKFDNVKSLGITEVPKRFKTKNNYDGYRAAHNCYEVSLKEKDDKGKEEDFYFVCEIQGKSIDAYYDADRGKAAKYHINPKQESGKIAKGKRLPDILNANTEAEKEEVKNKIIRRVPRFRIYRHNNSDINSEPNVYKMSLKESFILYYYNQLFGNEKLAIPPKEKEYLDKLIKSDELVSSKDNKLYKNYNYSKELNER